MSAAIKGEIQALLKTNRPGDAKKLCRSLCKKNKKDAEAWFLMGYVYAQTGETRKAIDSLRQSISINDRVAITHTNLGLVYLHNGQAQLACDSFARALEIEPDAVNTLFSLGNAYRASQQLDKAESTYRKLLKLSPDLSGALNNLGLTLFEKGLPEQAENLFRRSIELDPEQHSAYLNLAKSFREQRKYTEAEDTLQRALTIHPEKPEIHWDLSLALLELGRFREGWDHYKWRLKGGGTIHREFPVTSWQGEDISDKTILVTAEQGIGDEIMFASCFPDLIEAANQVIIDCEERLAPIFQRSFPRALIHPCKQTDKPTLPDAPPVPDVHCSAGSLPGIFRDKAERFPKHAGYLRADTEDTENWQRIYKQLKHPFTVGISWKGGHISQSKKRSSSIEDWAPLLSLPNINFVSLQYGNVKADIKEAHALFDNKIHNWPDVDPLKNMDRFASQIAALDLVVSVDNSTVHLAGALGKPTWVLQPFCPDWRWQTQSSTSYWYPSVLQFHPLTPGGWEGAIERVARELEDMLSAKSRLKHGKEHS